MAKKSKPDVDTDGPNGRIVINNLSGPVHLGVGNQYNVVTDGRSTTWSSRPAPTLPDDKDDE